MGLIYIFIYKIYFICEYIYIYYCFIFYIISDIFKSLNTALRKWREDQKFKSSLKSIRPVAKNNSTKSLRYCHWEPSCCLPNLKSFYVKQGPDKPSLNASLYLYCHC